MIGRVLCPIIILDMWLILVACLTKGKLWLISKTSQKECLLKYLFIQIQINKHIITITNI